MCPFLVSFPLIAHGSSASLLSGGSALYANTQEERQSYETRRLKQELMAAREQVLSLSSQLNTNVSRQFNRYFGDFFVRLGEELNLGHCGGD